MAGGGRGGQKYRRGRAVGDGIQSDLAFAFSDPALHHAVGREAALAAELLARMSRHPHGNPNLHAYRAAFIDRYDPDREVPLCELLDPDLGLGPPIAYGGALARDDRRDRALVDLAARASRERTLAVQLDDVTLGRLETLTPDDTPPQTVDIAVFVVATDPAAIDAGDFRIVVSPDAAVYPAGQNLGRVRRPPGPDACAALQAIDRLAGRERPDELRAEVVYLPAPRHLANVVVRPALRAYEIPFGIPPGVPWDYVIPLDELVVGLRHDRFYARWPRAGVDVVAVQGHMLRTAYAPPAARFLLDLTSEAGAEIGPFDWGPARSLPFLPRLEYGRIVLALAQWRLSSEEVDTRSDASFADTFDAWRRDWSLAKEVYLTDGDNRLLLDLDDRDHVAIVREELRRRTPEQTLFLQEALPGTHDAWLPGREGRHIAEVVVPVLRAASPRTRHHASAVARQRRAAVVSAHDRLRPPGSDWLYLKLYCPRALEEDLIVRSLRTFVDSAISSSLADAWFFIRYADPSHHLRVRFHGEPEVLLGPLIDRVASWARALVDEQICARFAFDTYEREVERYGGADAMSIADSLLS